MVVSLNVIALISGGKDSLYSILHCLESGHRVVALANLYPAPNPQRHGTKNCITSDEEDIDSFMYQTVGHRIVPLYSEALGLPLYRRAIRGSARQTQRDYETLEPWENEEDETEDLVPLLQDVLQHHPEANAISTGAILSNYQRTRVESVAIRLGLTPLSYLWQYPVLPPIPGVLSSMTGLLDDMEAVGCEARIIKIASGGLDENMLWADVCNPRTRTRLLNGMQRFVENDTDALKAAVLGEGGEFETLALSGPMPLWKKTIVVEEDTNVLLRGEGGTSSVKVGSAKLVSNTRGKNLDETKVRVPALLDQAFLAVQEACVKTLDRLLRPPSRMTRPSPTWSPPILEHSVNQSASTIYVSNLQCSMSVEAADLRSSILDAVSSLPPSQISPTQLNENILSSAVFATLLVRSMSSFALVNRLWTLLFSGKANPPARATVSCGSLLPEGIDFAISLVIDKGARKARDGLHVQSWSYWAPANIGPYSQSIVVPLQVPHVPNTDDDGHDTQPKIPGALIYIAGQIPLIPSTMILSAGSFLEQATLSLQHLWRIGRVQKVDWFLYGVAYLARDESQDIALKARTAHMIWQDTHNHVLDACRASAPDDADDEEIEEGPDAWDLQYGNHQTQLGSNSYQTTSMSEKSSYQIPNPKVISSQSKPPPFIAVEIESLPRSAEVEWQSLGTKGLQVDIDYPPIPKEDREEDASPIHNPGTTPTISLTTTTLTTINSTSTTHFLAPQAQFSVLTIPIPQPSQSQQHHHTTLSETLTALTASTTAQALTITNLTIYTTPSDPLSTTTTTTDPTTPSLLDTIIHSFPESAVTIIPCFRIWGTPTTSIRSSNRKDDETFDSNDDGKDMDEGDDDDGGSRLGDGMVEVMMALIIKSEH